MQFFQTSILRVPMFLLLSMLAKEVCVVSTIISFSNHIPCLERYRVSPADAKLTCFQYLQSYDL